MDNDCDRINSPMDTIIIDINSINEGDSLEEFLSATSYDVVIGMDNYIEREKNNPMHQIGKYDGGFLITDNLAAKNKAINNGIGLSVYINGQNDASSFSEALYCIETIKDMSDYTLNRMYERANGIPWTIFETKRCIVREIKVKDVDRLYEIYSDEDVKRYIEDLFSDKQEEINYTKDYIANQYRFFEYGLWVVILKETNELIGRAGIFDRENQDEIELGFVFDKSVWGKGIAMEVLEGVISYAREELGIKILAANVHPDNVKSQKLLEKLGFVVVSEKMIDRKNHKHLINHSL